MSDTFAAIEPADLPVARLYSLLTCTIQPRPIAFVSTISAAGNVNLAPFSFFNAGGSNPPCLVYCPVLNRHGEAKDSLLNVEETGEFVVNMVTRPIAEAVNLAGVDYPRDVDEFGVTALTPLASLKVRPPRVAESAVHYECKSRQVIRMGSGPSGTVFVIGEIVQIHIDRDLWRDGDFVPSDFRAVGRLGGSEYIDLAKSEIFEMIRPRLQRPRS